MSWLCNHYARCALLRIIPIYNAPKALTESERQLVSPSFFRMRQVQYVYHTWKRIVFDNRTTTVTSEAARRTAASKAPGSGLGATSPLESPLLRSLRSILHAAAAAAVERAEPDCAPSNSRPPLTAKGEAVAGPVRLDVEWSSSVDDRTSFVTGRTCRGLVVGGEVARTWAPLPTACCAAVGP